VAEAERLGLPWRSLPDPDLGWDVDDPSDLERFATTGDGETGDTP
jgi:2-phospho-L-lactate guanylyltransferase (CobY/MobA/RfbA family)